MDNIPQKTITIKESTEKVNKLYGDLNYYDLYGGSVILFIILMIVLFLVYAYTTIMKNVQPIKENWAVERCNPKVIPFAGFINKPEGASTIQYTQDNFNFCMQNILTSITGYAVEPLTYITASLTSLYGEIANTLNSIRTIISNVRTNMAKIAQEILGRILNIMTPIQMILISFMDLMGKVQGIFAAGLYTSLGTYYTLKSLMGAILQLVVIVLMILAGLIAGLWILPFTWPAAITGTAVFLSVSIPLIIIIAFMNQVLHVDINSPIPSVPGPRHCFDGRTHVTMNNGSQKPIEEIKVGEILANNNVVTAKLKLDAKEVEMFQLGEIIVSGSHLVKHTNQWIQVKDHPLALALSYCEPYIYCLNTSLKTVAIGAFEFSDWDEVFSEEKQELLLHLDSDSSEDIHKFYDGGFYSSTKIEMENGESREISNLEIGAVLKDGTRVVGLVEISGKNLGGTPGVYGINLQPVFINNQANLEKETIENNYSKNYGKNVYHLLTNKHYFWVNGIKYFHYNSQIELFLEKYRGKILSIKYV
uniref:Vint domain-containing protein n=1 Tax=viral metagenome TaxID=1070528 RepID=A0A6C0HC03_9ZZZZ